MSSRHCRRRVSPGGRSGSYGSGLPSSGRGTGGRAGRGGRWCCSDGRDRPDSYRASGGLRGSSGGPCHCFSSSGISWSSGGARPGTLAAAAFACLKVISVCGGGGGNDHQRRQQSEHQLRRCCGHCSVIPHEVAKEVSYQQPQVRGSDRAQISKRCPPGGLEGHRPRGAGNDRAMVSTGILNVDQPRLAAMSPNDGPEQPRSLMFSVPVLADDALCGDCCHYTRCSPWHAYLQANRGACSWTRMHACTPHTLRFCC